MKIFIALFAVLSMAAVCRAGYIRSYYPSQPVVNVVHDYAPAVHHVHHVQPVYVTPRSFNYGYDHSYISQPAPLVRVVKVHSAPTYSYGGWWNKKK